MDGFTKTKHTPFKTTHRTMECATCEKMYDCKGIPLEVEKCLNYIERKKEGDGYGKTFSYGR